ncbi:CPLD70 [Auxenochlorella protothecoides x Auxenochlorella symbiontica]
MAAPPSPAPTPNLLRELEGRSKELIDRLEQGVQAEIQAQRDRVHRLVLDTPLPVLQRRGLVLVGLAAAPCGTLHTDLLVRLTPPEGTLLSRHSFVPGQPVVLLASESGQPAGPVLDATVVSQHGLKWLTVAVGGAGAAAVLDPGARRRWRMDAGPCLAPLQRQLDALGALGRLEGLRPGEARVRAVLLGEPRVARAAAAAPPAWARDARWAPAVADALARCGALNPSQRAAVGAALGATFSLWQGPPGTGKTQTLLALIQVALAAGRAARCGPGPILAVAETNAGADNLLEGLRARGVAAVRVGQPARVRPDLRALTLDALSERTGEGARAVKLRERASALLMRGRDRTPVGAPPTPGHPAATPPAPPPPLRLEDSVPPGMVASVVTKAWREADALSEVAAARVLRAAQVVVATCASSAERRLARARWALVVLDEAAQAGEASTLCALLRGAEAVVAAGDPAQLPPLTLGGGGRRPWARQGDSDWGRGDATAAGGGEPRGRAEGVRRAASGAARSSGAAAGPPPPPTLFHRLAEEAGLPVSLLDTQYRMHPALASFPSRLFYDGRLASGVGPADRPAVAGVAWPAASAGDPSAPPPLLFVESGGREQLVGSSAGSSLTHTYNNTLEAQAALALAEAISAADPSVRSVAILTPYAGQAASLLRHADPTRLRVARPADAEGDGALAAPDCADARGARPRGPLVCISTIDGFQGREADVVLLSTTRTQRLGFLADRRRVNVAITRARRGLVVLGCSALLRTHPVWREWLREAGHVPEAQPQRAERGGRRPRISADPGCYGGGCGVEENFL